MSQVVSVAVTGAAGLVAYVMLARLASGEVFGANTKVILQLLEITPALTALEGVAMELEDCGFPTLKDVVVTDDPTKACLPFHLAVNGAAEAGIETEINLAGDAAVLIQDKYIDTLTPLGMPPLRELLAKARDKGVPIFV